ncbi:hypothetical protein Micbo1qcDRAFT_169510 [Microdochium bolleyi]|uniref:Uncharacterized protein n=1 Tax=Microdochium bolleyi TaxID=196109 RepID=A0A136IL05_9PEZI|nr:hypothetical protein Micbo1qcDRAFT_169510 [Microdochium bolleyi]
MAEPSSSGGTRLSLAAEALQTARNVQHAFARSRGRRQDRTMMQLTKEMEELITLLTALSDVAEPEQPTRPEDHTPAAQVATTPTAPLVMEPLEPFDNSVDGWIENPGWRWPWWKFDLEPSDLFTTLHQKFNTYQAPLQDFEAFHHDVSELGAVATDKADLYRRLAVRQRQRFTEMNTALDSISSRITGAPSCYDAAKAPTDSITTMWTRGVAFFRSRSLDMVVRYFAALLPLEDEETGLPLPLLEDASTTEPPPLDNEADISVASTVEDSISSDSENSVADLQILHPIILGNDSPLRSSHRSRHFAHPEPVQFLSKPASNTEATRKTRAPSTQIRQTDDATSAPAPRYGLRSSHEKSAAATNTGDPAPARKRKPDCTNTRAKRQRIT